MPSIDVVIISFLLVISIISTLFNGVVILTQMNRFSKEEIAKLVILFILSLLTTVYSGLQLASLTEKDKARKKLLMKQTEGALWTLFAYVVIVCFLLLAYDLRKEARQDNGTISTPRTPIDGLGVKQARQDNGTISTPRTPIDEDKPIPEPYTTTDENGDTVYWTFDFEENEFVATRDKKWYDILERVIKTVNRAKQKQRSKDEVNYFTGR